MRVVVLGSSGLLGRACVERLMRAGHEVIGVSRRGEQGSARPTTIVRTDICAASETALDALVHGADAVVHAFGPDDRDPMPRPVEGYLQQHLVAPTVRVARACARQGVGRLIVLGSVFTTLDRVHPERNLARRHPYIGARVAQADQVQRAATGTAVRVSLLEIPYVFGPVAGLAPAWAGIFVEQLQRGPVGWALAGGSAAVASTDVAEAVAGIAEGRLASGTHPLCVDNVGFARMTALMLRSLDRRRPVVRVPGPLVTAHLVAMTAQARREGRGLGLTSRLLYRDLLRHDLSLDTETCGRALGLVPRPLDPEIIATAAAFRTDRRG